MACSWAILGAVTRIDVDTAFTDHQPYLRGVAYRLLGSVAEADDIVQEAWLRYQRADRSDVRDRRAWLTQVVARLCLDHLGSARARREQYVGTWLPEPVVERHDPVDAVILDESVSLAMLVVLESLTPAERTAFVLHDIFGMSFDEVAEAIGRSPAACRKLAWRARRRVADDAPRATTDAAEHRRAVEAFLAATAGGSLEELVSVLDPDVVWRADGGGAVTAARRPVTGARRVARLLASIHGARRVEAAPAVVNGAPGYLMRSGGEVVGAVALGVRKGRVVSIDVVRNPAKLRPALARHAESWSSSLSRSQ